jgi:hypothetical protein
MMYGTIRRTIALTLAAALLALAVAACGSPRKGCSDGAVCAAPPTPTLVGGRALSTTGPTTLIETPTMPVLSTLAPGDLTPSATPITPSPGPPSATPPPTATLMPPDPSKVTPRPADRPFTPRPRPVMPVAADIKLGSDGKYYADVDGCHWAEYGRFADPQTGGEEIGMQTPCLPYEGLHYNPKTGALSYFIQ